MKRPKIEFKCTECGKPQQKNKNKSNENWNVYDCNQKCSCGGEFGMYMDGQLVGGGGETD